jgi:general secretion pathway protein A
MFDIPLEVFSISPNPGAMYLTPAMVKGVARIKRAITRKQGLSMLLGDIGLGKSSLLRYIAMQFTDQKEYAVAFVPDVQKCKTTFEFVKLVSAEFGIEAKRSQSAQLEAIESFLAKNDDAGIISTIFVDEGQKLPQGTLDLIRSLLNFETDTHKLAQFVIAGQLELQEALIRPKMAAVRSRVVAKIQMQPLTLADTQAMIQFRLQSWDVEDNLFDEQAVRSIHQLSAGVPRRILLLCRQACDIAADETAQLENSERSLPRMVSAEDVAEADRLLQIKEEEPELEDSEVLP